MFSCVFLLTYSSEKNTSVAQTKAESNTEHIKVFNNIDHLQIVGSKIEKGRFTVSIKNNFDKIVNSFYLTTGDVSYHTELIYSDVKDGVAPSSEFDISTDLDKNLFSNGLTVRAILFEDGTGEGQPSLIQEMKDKRYGEKLELTKGRDLLEKLLSSGALEGIENFSEIKEKFASLPSTEKNTQNESIMLGIDSGRQRFLRYIDELSKNSEANKPDNRASEITKARNKLEKYISKL